MYSKRIVAFIDIMGFKELLFRPATFEEINDILKEFEKGISKSDENFAMEVEMLKAKIEAPKDGKLHFNANKGNVTFASDCVIWSYPIDDIKIDYWHVVLGVVSFLKMIQTHLHYKGIVIRGGVTIGNLYQHGNKVFGDGLVKSYLLEKQADFPRIVIDREVLAPINTNILKALFLKSSVSFDRHLNAYYVDLIKYYALSRNLADSERQDKGLRAMLDEIASERSNEITQVINSGLSNKKWKIKIKYFWLYQEAKKHTSLFQKMQRQGLSKIGHVSYVVLFSMYYYRILKIRLLR